jgi:hypothetical protein
MTLALRKQESVRELSYFLGEWIKSEVRADIRNSFQKLTNVGERRHGTKEHTPKHEIATGQLTRKHH